MATVRTFKELLRDKEIGPRIVPIIPDEARTFGMDSWFPSLKIYNRNGQLYTAVDAELMLAYKESEIGHILHEGINEAGSTASFTAVGTSYATHNEPMIPIYIFYSMFGFQRTGDGFWAAADQMARGFVLGATAGRTTLTGEGLQHADGHSLLLAATNPAVVAYDPAFAYEIAYIVESGLHRMYGENPENVYFYMTIYNEPYVQPAEPEDLDVEGLLRGIYRYRQRAGEAHQRRADPGLGRGHARSAAGGRTAGRGLGRRRRRVVGDQLGRAQPRRRGDREGTAAPSRAARRARRSSPRRWPTPPGRWSRCPTGCGRCPSRSGRGCPAPTSRWAPTGSASPTPARGAPVLQHRRRVGRGRRCWRAWPATASIDPSVAVDGGPQVPDRRRAGAPASDVQGHRQRLSYARHRWRIPHRRIGVAFRDGRQSVYPAEVHARGAGDGAGVGAAPVEAVLRAAGHRSGARHGGAAAVLRRPGGVAAGQRATGRADRGGQLRRVDARPAEQRQLHGAGVRGGPAGPAAAHRAAPVGRDGAGHDGVLRGSGAAAGPLRRAVHRDDRRNPALQPGFGVRRGRPPTPTRPRRAARGTPGWRPTSSTPWSAGTPVRSCSRRPPR